jgi:hypothetical protein
VKVCTETTDISIALIRAGSLIPLKAASCRSQALYLLFKSLSFLVEPCDLRFWHIGATQLIKHLADGEFAYYSHSKILCAIRGRLPVTRPGQVAVSELLGTKGVAARDASRLQASHEPAAAL